MILKALSENMDWKYAQQKLLESGLIPSRTRAYDLKKEISKRFTDLNVDLPSLRDLILVGSLNLSLSIKKKIYFVYLLYYSEPQFAKRIDFLRDIANADKKPIQQNKLTYKKLILKEINK